MSRCASHGELVGGYVLGVLEPAEMEEMRRHVAGCPTCGVEVRRMSELPGLLDMVQPDDVPPPAASPELEEAILDRFARERPRLVESRRRLRKPALMAAAAATVLALALALVLLVSRDEQDSSAYASARLAALDRGSGARATAYVDAVPAGTKVTLGARGLAAGGAAYELWCVRTNGDWVSGGTFRSGTGGRARAELTAAVEPGDYHVIVIARASPPAGDPGPGTPVLRGKLRY
jgi:anti-sigma-K factor RskA